MDKRKQIVERLDGKTNAEIIAEEYTKIQKELWDSFDELKNFGDECNCEEDTETVKIIHEGSHEDTDEIHRLCLKCGGYLSYNGYI
jgi:hypothetical protein